MFVQFGKLIFFELLALLLTTKKYKQTRDYFNILEQVERTELFSVSLNCEMKNKQNEIFALLLTGASIQRKHIVV